MSTIVDLMTGTPDPDMTDLQRRLVEQVAIAVDAVVLAEGWEVETRGFGLLWESVILRHRETGERTWLSLANDAAPVVEPEPGTQVWVEATGMWRRAAVAYRWPGGITYRWTSKKGHEFTGTASNGGYRPVEPPEAH